MGLSQVNGSAMEAGKSGDLEDQSYEPAGNARTIFQIVVIIVLGLAAALGCLKLTRLAFQAVGHSVSANASAPLCRVPYEVTGPKDVADIANETGGSPALIDKQAHNQVIAIMPGQTLVFAIPCDQVRPPYNQSAKLASEPATPVGLGAVVL